MHGEHTDSWDGHLFAYGKGHGYFCFSCEQMMVMPLRWLFIHHYICGRSKYN